jgi:hypothetical protein
MSEEINLTLDNENEIVFKVNVEGTGPAKASCRLVIESNGVSYGFEGSMRKNEAVVTIPPLKRMLAEGSYQADLEVLIDDRIFTPLRMKANFRESIKVSASRLNKEKKGPNATASIVSSTPAKKRTTLVAESQPDIRKSEMSEKVRKIIREKIESIPAVSEKNQESPDLRVSESDIDNIMKRIAKRKRES